MRTLRLLCSLTYTLTYLLNYTVINISKKQLTAREQHVKSAGSVSSLSLSFSSSLVSWWQLSSPTTQRSIEGKTSISLFTSPLLYLPSLQSSLLHLTNQSNQLIHTLSHPFRSFSGLTCPLIVFDYAFTSFLSLPRLSILVSRPYTYLFFHRT